MELNSFGAIMGFAIEIESKLLKYYQDIYQKFNDNRVEEIVQSQEKAVKSMEQTRRENVAEMILIAIQNVKDDDYPLDISVPNSMEQSLQKAIQLEETAIAFFKTASMKIGVDDVERYLKKLVKNRQKRIELLQ